VVKIFVISLAGAVVRRESIERQLRLLQLDYEIVPGVLGRGLSPQEREEHCDDVRFRRLYGGSITAGHLGCSLSHIAVYRRMVEGSINHALVLEDDAWLNPNLPQLLQAIGCAFSPDDEDVILLSWAIATSRKFCKRVWSSYDVVGVRNALCTHGYVLSRAAAERLLAVLYPVRHNADCWTWLRRHGHVRVLAVAPTCITLDLSMESMIAAEVTKMNNDRSRRQRPWQKVYRGFWEAVDLCAAAIHRLGGPRRR